MLAIDIMYINQIPFMMMISRAIHFGTAELIKTKIFKYISCQGLKIRHILEDGQFKSAWKHIEAIGIMLNVTGYIRTVKERVRVIVNILPFENYPHWLVVETVYNTIFWLNCFPHKNGVHATLSPRAIITGSHISYKKHCHLQFGSYVQVHDQHDNLLLPIISGANALHPTGNMQGTYYFLNRHSGKRIVRNNWTQLPMPNEVIATVHQLAVAFRKYKGIIFTDKNGNIIDDHNDPENDNLEITGVDGNTDNGITGVNANSNTQNGNNTQTETTETHDITGVTRMNEEINNNTRIYETDNNTNIKSKTTNTERQNEDFENYVYFENF